MSKPSDKTKEQVRFRRDRNFVAKNNKHRGGFHTPDRYVRRKPQLTSGPIPQAELNEYWEENV